MSGTFNDENTFGRRSFVPAWFWGALLAIWFLLFCLIPDPRPLGAPDWAVKSVLSLTGLSEPGARAIATIVLRGFAMALLGFLLAKSVSRLKTGTAAAVAIISVF